MGIPITRQPVKVSILDLADAYHDLPVWKPRFTGRVMNGTRHHLGSRGIRL